MNAVDTQGRAGEHADRAELETLEMLEASCLLRGLKLPPELAFKLHQLRRKAVRS